MNNLLYNLIILFSFASSTILFVILIILNAFKRLKKLALWKYLIIYIPTFIICIIMYIIVPNNYNDIVLPAKIFAPILSVLYAVIGKIWFGKTLYYTDDDGNVVSEDDLSEK